MDKRWSYIIATYLILLCTAAAAQRLDSITRIIPTVHDSLKMYYYDSLAYEYENLDSVEKYSKLEYQKALQYEKLELQYNSQLFMGYAYYYREQYDKAIDCYNKMLEICDKEQNPHHRATTYRKLGTAYSQTGSYKLSDQYYNMAISEFQKHNDNKNIASILRYQGYTYVDFSIFDAAYKNFDEAYRLDSIEHDTTHLVDDLFSIGRSNYIEYQYYGRPELLEKALINLRTAYFFHKDVSISMKIHILTYMLNIYADKAFAAPANEAIIYADSLQFFYRLLNEKNSQVGMFNQDEYIISKANYKALIGKPREAIQILDSLYSVYKNEKNKAHSIVTEIFHSYIQIYKMMGELKNTLKYTNLLLQFEKEKRGQDFMLTLSNNKYEQEINERIANERVLKEHLEGQQQITSILLVFILVATLLIIMLTSALRKNKKYTSQLTEQNIEISNQRDLLNMAKTEIESSIRYAERIQQASLPDPSIIKNAFTDYFVVFKPLNIVSGDFYWASQRGDITYVAVADCTGHGVPGGFMSMLGISSLNDIVTLNSNETQASVILNSLSDKIIESLHQKNETANSKDGMDVALIVYNKKSKTIQFAGAHRPLWILRQGEITETKADKMPVGISLSTQNQFTNHTIQVEPGDILYMFSDGITDQFGILDGEREKYSAFRLRNTLKKTSGMFLHEQKKMIETDLTDWQSELKQLDDQIILGLMI